MVNDQYGTPTWAEDLSRTIFMLVNAVEKRKNIHYGIYHYTNEGHTALFAFAEEIQRLERQHGLITGDCVISPCTSDEYPAKAKYPAYSVLDKSKIKAALEIEIPSWQRSLEKYMETL